MSAEDLEKYETEMELQLYREYRDVVGLFTYVVETERRFYLTNSVDLDVRTAENGDVYFDVRMQDAWVWDMYRPARFVKNVRVVTFKDVNIEELAKPDLEMPKEGFSSRAGPPRPPGGRRRSTPAGAPGETTGAAEPYHARRGHAGSARLTFSDDGAPTRARSTMTGRRCRPCPA